jgi:hypothetical protein
MPPPGIPQTEVWGRLKVQPTTQGGSATSWNTPDGSLGKAYGSAYTQGGSATSWNTPDGSLGKAYGSAYTQGGSATSWNTPGFQFAASKMAKLSQVTHHPRSRVSGALSVGGERHATPAAALAATCL